MAAAAAAQAEACRRVLAQPSSTVEELYLLARIAQVCRSANIDHACGNVIFATRNR